MSTAPDRYAVFGNPVSHSKSPQIHALFAAQTGQSLNYSAVLVAPGEFASAADAFLHNHGKGLNITIPFKQDAWSYASERSKRAQRAGAVNTLKLQADGSIYGDTTDGTGLVRDLMLNHRIQIKDSDILLIGAGGAVRGVIEALLEQQPASLLIANRTKLKALQLAQDFSDLGYIYGCGLDEITSSASGDGRFDIVINATSSSLLGDLPALPDTIFRESCCCYDMMYGAEATPFMRWCSEHGVSDVFDGLGMLVEQAAESFYIWRGVRPQTEPVIRQLRETPGT